MSKQTRLEEDAEIYQPRKQQSEKEKLRDMPMKEKISYLWMYYRLHAIITIAIIVSAAYIIHNIVTPDVKIQLYAVFVNNPFDEQTLDNYKADFSKYLKLDEKTENVFFDTTFQLGADSEYSMNLQQAFSTKIAAQEFDVIIAPKSQFTNYAYYGYFRKLSDELPTDVYSNLTDRFLISDTEDDSEKNAYGIYMSDTNLFKDVNDEADPYILGIVANAKHQDNSVEFIRYLFQ